MYVVRLKRELSFSTDSRICVYQELREVVFCFDRRVQECAIAFGLFVWCVCFSCYGYTRHGVVVCLFLVKTPCIKCCYAQVGKKTGSSVRYADCDQSVAYVNQAAKENDHVDTQIRNTAFYRHDHYRLNISTIRQDDTINLKSEFIVVVEISSSTASDVNPNNPNTTRRRLYAGFVRIELDSSAVWSLDTSLYLLLSDTCPR